MKMPLMLSERAKSWAANAKAKFQEMRHAGERERERMWDSEQKRRRAALELEPIKPGEKT